MIVTKENEMLLNEGIHGTIGSVGKGFGTGRHTANARLMRKAITDESYHVKI